MRDKVGDKDERDGFLKKEERFGLSGKTFKIKSEADPTFAGKKAEEF